MILRKSTRQLQEKRLAEPPYVDVIEAAVISELHQRGQVEARGGALQGLHQAFLVGDRDLAGASEEGRARGSGPDIGRTCLIVLHPRIISLDDVEHSDLRVAAEELRHDVAAQETGAADDCVHVLGALCRRNDISVGLQRCRGQFFHCTSASDGPRVAVR